MNTILAEAKEHLVGGVNSPVRTFKDVGCDPIFITEGEGSKIYDTEGKSYIDYMMSFGAIMLGHAHPGVVRDTRGAVGKGLNFGTTTRVEVALAAFIKDAVPSIEKIRFVNSGTEAVMSAIRLARGYTSRDKILKFEDSYHGHADYLLTKGGSGLASLGIPASEGVPSSFTEHTLVSGYGDIEGIDRVFETYGSEIAAVVVEPAGGNHGVTPPDRGFLEKLSRVTDNHGALLIFDEVITGFRSSFGTLGDELGIIPDLTCLGKIIGGGLPVGAYGGRREIMSCLAPEGKVYQASTFAGNPVVMQAGLTTLETLYRSKNLYDALIEMTRELSEAVRDAAGTKGIELDVSFFGTMFSFHFREKDMFRSFFRGLLSQGIYIAPSEYESNFISFAHTPYDIKRTKNTMRYILEEKVAI